MSSSELGISRITLLVAAIEIAHPWMRTEHDVTTGIRALAAHSLGWREERQNNDNDNDDNDGGRFCDTLIGVLSHQSAFKHGLTIDRIEHAYDHVIALADLDPDSDPPKVLLIRPDAAGNLLELIALILADDELLVIHAMPLRPTFYSLLPDPSE